MIETKNLVKSFHSIEVLKGVSETIQRGAVGQGLGYAVANRGGCHLNGGYLVVLEGLGLSVNKKKEETPPEENSEKN